MGKIIFLIIAALSVVWLWITFVILMRKRKERILVALSEEERVRAQVNREKQSLREFFGLDVDSSREDLVRQYRVMAKEMHPDTGQGTEHDFTVLQERYRSAQDLLFGGIEEEDYDSH